MKSIWKKICYAVLRYLAYQGFHFSKHDKALARLKNIHKGQRCFIIGNGPSLLMQDLQTLHEHGEICFGLNKIYLAFPQTDWRPTYYCVEDRMTMTENYEQINALPDTICKFIPDYTLNRGMKTFDNAIYFRHRYRNCYPKLPQFSYNVFHGIWGGNTGVYICCQLAYHMGIQSVYLLGVDCNYSMDSIVVTATDEGEVLKSQGGNDHFHSQYYRMGEKICHPNTKRHLTAYQSMRKVFSAHNRKIYNATRGGHLEVFTRVDFDRLFHE